MVQHLLFFDLGTGEIALILLVTVLLFGPKKIPEIARGLGKGIRQFKDAANDVNREIRDNANAVKKGIEIEEPQQVKEKPEQETSSKQNEEEKPKEKHPEKDDLEDKKSNKVKTDTPKESKEDSSDEEEETYDIRPAKDSQVHSSS